jgi:hypothetical protein
MTVDLDRSLIDDRDRGNLCGPDVQRAVTLGKIEELRTPVIERLLGSGCEIGRCEVGGGVCVGTRRRW